MAAALHVGSEREASFAGVRERLRGRLPELDGIRGLAIVLVLICHYGVNLLDPPKHSVLWFARAALSLTWTGVDLFFVLSGFLIGGILIDTRSSPRFFQTFYARRFFRIFPIYFLSLGLFWLLQSSGAVRYPGMDWLLKNPMPLLTHATFTQNVAMAIRGEYGPHWLDATWSLAVEEQFYLILPVLVFFLPPLILQRTVVASIFAAPILSALIVWWKPDALVAAYVLMPCRADALGLGVLAAILLRRGDSWIHSPGVGKALHWAFFVLLLGMGGVIVLGRSGNDVLMNSIGFSWIALFYLSVLLVGVLQPKSTLGAILRHPILLEFGKLSYFIYLFHQPFSGLSHALLRGSAPAINDWLGVAATILALALTLAAAQLSWRYLEKPLIAIGHRRKY